MHKAIFLDRDGVIIEQKPHHYKINETVFIPGVFEALQLAQEAGYKLIIITNQAGIAKQKYTEQDYHTLMSWMGSIFSAEGILFDAVYYCPHHPDGVLEQYRKICDCRKPNPGLLHQAIREKGVDISRSFMIGDQTWDILAGKRVGCKTILVQTGYGGKDGKYEVDPDYVAADLKDAIHFILKS